ncbi:hypothetical protein MASR2M32_34760 [Sphaerotilus sulfidivorans]
MQFEPDRHAGDLAQDALDALAELRADPVALEPVGSAQVHANRRAVHGHVGRGKRADPRVELLLRQLGGEAFKASIPQVRLHVLKIVDNFERRGAIVSTSKRPG